MRYDTTPFEELILYFPKAELDRIFAARAFAEKAHEGKVRASGDPESKHCVGVASILARMGVDADCIIAGLLHDVCEDAAGASLPAKPSQQRAASGAKAGAPCPLDAVAASFGEGVVAIILALRRITELRSRGKTVLAAESARKMMFAVSPDLRVVLVKLADKLDNMRTLSYLGEEERKRIATECLDVFAPVADRLGIGWMKDELEDRSLKALNRPAYDQIKSLVAGNKDERGAFLARVEAALLDGAERSGIAVEVKTRAKHFYSIYRKMRKRSKAQDELFDLFGVRVICGTENECYAMLGVVHSLWKPVTGRFKDYVANPKRNGYASLHTTVTAFDGQSLEVQIRTRAMDEIAEFGVASHWLYKARVDAVGEGQLDAAARAKGWHGDKLGDSAFMGTLREEMLGDSIVVFTPAGDAIELRSGATPLDFAFAIHTSVGLKCVGAKVDGHIAPLDASLEPAQTVEILTSAAAKPNVNWLRIAHSSKARSKIRQWLLENDQVLAIDRNIVAKKRQEKSDEAERRQPDRDQAAIPERVEVNRRGDATLPGSSDIEVEGTKGMMIRIARCCSPVSGDPILGFVSRGRGLVVHRADCENARAIPGFEERMVECAWVNPNAGFTRRFRVVARADGEIFMEIENAIRKSGARLVEGRVEREGDRMKGRFMISAGDRESLRKAVRDLRSLPVIFRLDYD